VSAFLWAALGVIGGLGLAAIGDLVSEEIRGRLDHLPHAILRLAAWRLSPALRDDVYADEWMPELTYILRGDEARPITRLYHGIRFALGILVAARRIGRGLTCSPELALEAQLAIEKILTEFTGIRDTCAVIDDRLELVETTLASSTVGRAVLANGEVISGAAWPLITQLVRDGRLATGGLLTVSASAIQRLRDAREELKEPGGRISSRDVEQLWSLNADIRLFKARTRQSLTEAVASLANSAKHTPGSLEQGQALTAQTASADLAQRQASVLDLPELPGRPHRPGTR
jgi:hypothetical protein